MNSAFILSYELHPDILYVCTFLVEQMTFTRFDI